MTSWFIFALIGILSGLSSGLLGLGGGIIIVPSLIAVFTWQGMPDSYLIHIAIGTSLMTIIVTSLSSIYAHQQHANINWSVARQFAPGLIVGGVLGAFLATILTGDVLQKCFAVYVFIAVVLMWYRVSSSIGELLLKRPILFGAGTISGSISALVGIGGGSFVVPYLIMAQQPISRAIGTSAACGLLISISAVTGFIVSSNLASDNTSQQLSLIHWGAFWGIISTSILFSVIGVRLSKRLPVKVVKKIFSLVLIMVGIALLN